MNRIIEFLSDIWYKIQWRITEIPWYLKRESYRREFWNKICSYYVAPWDIVDALFDIPFETFVLFYEKGRLDLIEWESDEEHKQVRKTMDDLYTWYTKDYPQSIANIEETWGNFHIHYPFPSFSSNSKKGSKEKEIQQIIKQEDKLEKEKDKYLKKLLSIRAFLWT